MAKEKKFITCDGNFAASQASHRHCPIFPLKSLVNVKE